MKFGLFKTRTHSPRHRLERLGEFNQRVSGEVYYQRTLDDIAGGRTAEGHEFEKLAEIIVDDGNRREGSAVRIDIDNRTVGHLARRDARQYLAWLKNQNYPERVVMECRAVITGGWDRGRNDRGAYEVYLDLPALDPDWVEY